MAREPLCDPYNRQWRWLLLYGGSRETQLVGLLYAESAIRYYFPYPIANELHLSRNLGDPWDDEGLPVVVAEGDGTYSVRRGDGSPHVRGTPAEAVAGVVGLLEDVERPRHADSRRMDLEQARERAWPTLARSGDQRVRRVAERLFREPEARRYYPHLDLHDVKLSRNEVYPWDDEGLPQLFERAEQEYVVLDGDGELRGSGDLASAVAVLVQLLAAIRTATREFRDVFGEALHRGAHDELLAIVRRYKRLGLGQREAHDALVDLLKGRPELLDDAIFDVLDVIDGSCLPQSRIWETGLDL